MFFSCQCSYVRVYLRSAKLDFNVCVCANAHFIFLLVPSTFVYRCFASKVYTETPIVYTQLYASLPVIVFISTSVYEFMSKAIRWSNEFQEKYGMLNVRKYTTSFKLLRHTMAYYIKSNSRVSNELFHMQMLVSVLDSHDIMWRPKTDRLGMFHPQEPRMCRMYDNNSHTQISAILSLSLSPIVALYCDLRMCLTNFKRYWRMPPRVIK